MQRVRVAGFGDVSQVDVIDAPEPAPGDGEVLVAIRAAGLNYADLMQREGLYVGGPRPPFFPGIEAAGIVAAQGANVTSPAVGARVMVMSSGGLLAERAVVPAGACVALPGALSFEAGAAFAVSFLTAHHALTTVAHARHGEVAVIHAAGGGVGTAAVQIARTLGLRVIATASTEAKRDRVRALGAEIVVDYDGFAAAARALGGAAIVLDSVGGEVLRRSLGVLAPLGRLVVLGFAARQAPAIDPVKLMLRSQAVLGFHLSAITSRPDLVAPSLATLLDQIAAGELAIEVGHTLPLAEIRRAHELLASRQRYGKVVLVP